MHEVNTFLSLRTFSTTDRKILQEQELLAIITAHTGREVFLNVTPSLRQIWSTLVTLPV